MDLQVEIKEEPVWDERPATASFISADVKKEPPISQLVPFFRDVHKWENVAVFKRDPVDSYDSHSKLLETKCELMCHCNACHQHQISKSEGKLFHSKESNSKCSLMSNLETHVSSSSQKPLYCNECGKSFPQKRKLNYKVRTHIGEKPYGCCTCGKKFSLRKTSNRQVKILDKKRNDCDKSLTQKGKLNFNVRTNTGEKPYGCERCGKQFSLRKVLNRHTKIHDGMRNDSDKLFPQKGKLNSDMQTHTGEKPYPCAICGKKFFVRQSLNRHLKIHNGTPNECVKLFPQKGKVNSRVRTYISEKPFGCETCGKKYPLRKTLNRHMKIHNANRNKCGKSFPKKGKLNSNMRIHHSGEKPNRHMKIHNGLPNKYAKSFPQEGKLKSHVRKHVSERPFGCDRCGKIFSYKTSLNRHMKIHNGNRSHFCTVCGKTFYRNDHLLVHLQCHTAKKLYLRNICGKMFSNKNELDHMDIDTGSRPHCCSKCCKTFSRRDIFLAHMLQTHIGERPNHCTECGKSFVNKRSITRHMRSHVPYFRYFCNYCGKSYSEKRGLVGHLRFHSDEKSYILTRVR